jgi:hypothetical protein
VQRLARTLVSVLAHLRENQFTSGLVLPAVLGFALYQLRALGNMVYEELKSTFLCEVQVKNSDPCFRAVLAFIAEHQKAETQLVCSTKKERDMGWRQRWMRDISGMKAAPDIEYGPAQSSRVQFIEFQGHQIMVTRERGETITTGYSRQPLELETIHLSSWAASCAIIKVGGWMGCVGCWWWCCSCCWCAVGAAVPVSLSMHVVVRWSLGRLSALVAPGAG